MRALKHRVNDLLRTTGWEIQRKQVHVHDFIRAKRITTVLDVGANTGQYASGIRARGYQGRIVSFEPDPRSFSQLSLKAARDKKWDARNLAVGACNGKANFNISEYAEFSSFLVPSPLLMRFDRRSSVKMTRDVPVTTIDSIFGDLKSERVFLKSDTQGYEKQVILGASGALSNIIAVQLELGLFQLYEGQPSFFEMMELMHSHQFTPALIWPNQYSVEDPARLLEVDCVFLNENVG